MSREIYTTCTRDCPDACGIMAAVENGRVVKLKGHHGHEITNGRLCKKAPRFLKRVYSEERQLYPLFRAKGDINSPWQRTGWDNALDLVAEKLAHHLENYGPLSIMHYQRNGSWGVIKDLGHRFFNLLGGATTTSGSVCSGAARAGQSMDFGSYMGHDPVDFANSRLILLWGRNPAATGFHIIPFFQQAQKAGGKIILIDPVQSESAAICNDHIQVKAGRDAELAMAMAKIIIKEGLENKDFVNNHTSNFNAYRQFLNSYTLSKLCQGCGLPEEAVRKLAIEYATTRPAAIVLGWGLNKYRQSAETFRLIDALAALCGQLGLAGSGSTNMYDIKRHIDKSLLTPNKSALHRTIPEPQLGRGIIAAENPRIKMMYVNACNPVTQLPNSILVAKALAGLDFIVVADLFLTDTTDYAHVFLPATTFLEEEADVMVAYGHNILGGVNKIIEPRGESRPDLWIFQQLARRLGFEEDMAGSELAWLKRLFTPLEKAGVTIEQILNEPVRCPITPLVPFKDGDFPTDSGRFRFISSFESNPYLVEGFPLNLITSMSKDWILSQVLTAEHPKKLFVRINEETVSNFGLKNGNKALIRSPVGALEVEIIIDNRVGSDLVVMPVGTWLKHKGGPNVLTEDIISNYGEMAAYYETKVTLEALK